MNKIVTHVAVGVAALGLGGATGYLIGKRRANKAADAKIEEINEYWLGRINEAEGPAAIITSGETLQTTPIFDGIVATGSPETQALFDAASQDVIVESAPMFGSPTATAEDQQEEEIQPDFPDAPVEVADDFTVEGEAPAVDARAFVEQFKDRSVADFSAGVNYPGKLEQDADGFPVKRVEYITVRDPNGPYVISIDEYMDPESDPPFTKVEMRWFAGDKVLVDARDDQVPLSTFGAGNVDKFGEGTTDPNQVYIRNERLSIDIEVTREEGLYIHEVLGQDFADKSPVLKMREGDGD